MKDLYYGDNLEVLRESIKDESVDLIYLDPQFNSKRGDNLLFKSPDGLLPPSKRQKQKTKANSTICFKLSVVISNKSVH